jgi:hypothetical protein
VFTGYENNFQSNLEFAKNLFFLSYVIVFKFHPISRKTQNFIQSIFLEKKTLKNEKIVE